MKESKSHDDLSDQVKKITLEKAAAEEEESSSAAASISSSTNENLPKSPEKKCSGCKAKTNSNLYCPTCKKLNLPYAYFCSQNCFKDFWCFHKLLHKSKSEEIEDGQQNNYADQFLAKIKQNLLPQCYDENDQTYWKFDSHLKRFIGYKFTGSLRPWPVSRRMYVPKHIALPDYALTGISLSEIKEKKTTNIAVNSAEDILNIREACLLGRKALDLAASMIRAGVSTNEINECVHNFIIENDAYPSPLNYYNFPKSCCTSVNEVICHGIPDYRKLVDGDIVNVDITVYYKGMHGDLNETFCVGDAVDEVSKKLIKTCYECLEEAIKYCRVGRMYREIGNVISSVAEKKGFSVVRSYCGHGVGRLFHSYPNIPHYRKNKALGIMKAGHVFTIEPMINAGTWKDTTWPDEWTAVTVDGKRSAQFEHTILMTENGPDILTARLPSSPPLKFD